MATSVTSLLVRYFQIRGKMRGWTRGVLVLAQLVGVGVVCMGLGAQRARGRDRIRATSNWSLESLNSRRDLNVEVTTEPLFIAAQAI